MTTQQQTTENERTPQIGDAGFVPAAHADDDELAKAEAELAAEAGKPADATAEADVQADQPEPEAAEAEDATQAEPERAEAEPQPPAKPIMVPKARLDEALRRERETGERLARLEGMMAAIAGKGTGTSDENKPEPTPQERIEALEGDFDQLADKYEKGDLSTKEFEKAKLNIQRQIFRLEQEAAAPKPSAQTDDTYLQEQTDRLSEEFSALKTLSAADIEAIVPLAMRDAQRNNVDVSSNLKLRRHVAATAQRIYGEPTDPAKGQQTPAPVTTANPGDKARAKLEQARRSPPNLNPLSVSLTNAPPANGVPTREQFEAMSEDARAALPDSVLAKLAS